MITKVVIKKDVIELWEGDLKVESYAITESMTLKLDSLEKLEFMERRNKWKISTQL